MTRIVVVGNGMVSHRFCERMVELDRPRLIHELVRRVITRFIEDVIAESRGRLAKSGVMSADDVRAIKGQQSDDIERILGFRGRSEVIHRDDLAIGI